MAAAKVTGDPCLGRLSVIDRATAEHWVLRAGWLADQPEDVRNSVLKHARIVDYQAGEFIFHAGDAEGGIYGVITGGVGVHLPSNEGIPVLAHILRCGEWFGYGPLVRGRKRSLSFSLIEPSLLFHLPLSHAQEIAQSSLAHQRAIMSISEYGMDVATKVIETLLIRSTDRRIAATLLRVARSLDEGGSWTMVVLTQSQLGEMANAERQVVNRALKRLEGKGILRVSYGRIEIVDKTALQKVAGAG
jgi:CRP/FNR family cyclic AMP-dependent transcriptional regulator